MINGGGRRVVGYHPLTFLWPSLNLCLQCYSGLGPYLVMEFVLYSRWLFLVWPSALNTYCAQSDTMLHEASHLCYQLLELWTSLWLTGDSSSHYLPWALCPDLQLSTVDLCRFLCFGWSFHLRPLWLMSLLLLYCCCCSGKNFCSASPFGEPVLTLSLVGLEEVGRTCGYERS